jgi:hypothetical protein
VFDFSVLLALQGGVPFRRRNTPLAAPDPLEAGEIFLPERPKPLDACSSQMRAPDFMSGFVSDIAPAAPALAKLARPTETPTPASSSKSAFFLASFERSGAAIIVLRWRRFASESDDL